MNRRYSKNDRLRALAMGEGRTAEVLGIYREFLLVELEGLRINVPIEPSDRGQYWAGKRIELEVSDTIWNSDSQAESLASLFERIPSKGSESAYLPKLPPASNWQWLRNKPTGTLIEGKVILRKGRSIWIDFGHGCIKSTYDNYFLSSLRIRYPHGGMPEIGESLAMTLYGFSRNGEPILYAWQYDTDPKYSSYTAGYRSSYKGEDSPFLVLPWERNRSTN